MRRPTKKQQIEYLEAALEESLSRSYEMTRTILAFHGYSDHSGVRRAMDSTRKISGLLDRYRAAMLCEDVLPTVPACGMIDCPIEQPHSHS